MKLDGHLGEVYTVAFSPDGKTLATGGRDRVIRLWDVETGKLRASLWAISPLDPDGGPTEWAAFTPEGFHNGSARGRACLRFAGEERGAIQAGEGPRGTPREVEPACRCRPAEACSESSGRRRDTISKIEVLSVATDTTPKKSWVQKTPDVFLGRACIRNTRITVWGLVNSRRLGASDPQILKNIVGLTPEDLMLPGRTTRRHCAEVDRDTRDNELN